MKSKHTILINGQQYDAMTGLPVEEGAMKTRVISDFSRQQPTNAPRRTAPKQAPQAHVTTQKSQTLRREVVKKPIGSMDVHSARSKRPAPKAAKSTMIHRFAPHPGTITAKAPASPVDAPRPSMAQSRPAALRNTPQHTPTAPAAPASNRELKEHLISQKLAEVELAKQAPTHAKKRRLFAAKPKVSSVMAASFALLILGGYLTYLNMPSLSVKVAASQAGINASFPEYKPDGYRFDGPIAFAPGEVTIKFAANGGDQGYTVKQTTSSWDSQAVLDNYVAKKSDSYLTYSEKGLTIYTYDNKAAWVNGGILYTIDGDAPLSNEQVLRIASSL